MTNTLLVLQCTVLIILRVECFNIDAKHTFLSFNGPLVDTHFGAAVALQNTNRLIVGAPLANDTNNNEGAVYECQLKKGGSCTKVPISDISTLNPDRLKRQRNGQRLGMTISTVGDQVLVCAPRWFKETDTDKGLRNWYFGKCFTLGSNLNVRYENVPCENEYTGNTFYGFCMAGYSIAGLILKQKNMFVLGAPGSLNAKGSTFFIRDDKDFKNKNTDRLSVSALMGYSIAVGQFIGADGIHFAGGAPRGSRMKGKVIVYSYTGRTSKIIANIENPDDQVGAYFGGAVCAADLDGDGKDDLLIGSPLYTTHQDEGRVYVYMNIKGSTYSGFDLLLHLEGELTASAKFGSAISNLGDVNKDGYDDIIVGAPFGGKDGKGAVYIYNGGRNGLKDKYSQVIYASDVANVNGGFGISFSPGIDIDGNTYPDFAVGAYLDNKAYVFRSRPVVTLQSSLKSNVTKVPTEEEHSNCNGPDGKAYHCVQFVMNLKYSGKGTPNEYSLEVTVDLDPTKIGGLKRAFVLSAGRLVNTIVKNVTLKKDTVLEENFIVFFSLKQSVDFETQVTLISKFAAYDQPAGCGDNTCPVLDEFGSNRDLIQFSYLKRCGDDSICSADIQVHSHLVLPQTNGDEIVYGVDYEVFVNMTIKNIGEPAYQLSMKLNFSSDLQINGVDINKKQYILWNQRTIDKYTSQLEFPVANPLRSDQSVEVVAKFSITKPRPTVNTYVFSIEAVSNGVEKNVIDNRESHSINNKVQTCIRIQGEAKPNQIVYEEVQTPLPKANISVADIGKEVKYTFYVQNAGKTVVNVLLAEIGVVVEKLGLDFMYIVDLRVNDAVCPNNALNELNFTTVTPEIQDLSSEKRLRRDIDRVNCRIGNCKVYSCEINEILPGKGVPIYMTARLWSNNLAKLELKPSDVETLMTIKFKGLATQYVQKTGCNQELIVNLSVRSSKDGKKNSIKWWIILLAIVGALMLLAIACVIMYKVGFFKRNRKIKNISGPTGNEAENPQKTPDEYDDDDEEQ